MIAEPLFELGELVWFFDDDFKYQLGVIDNITETDCIPTYTLIHGTEFFTRSQCEIYQFSDGPKPEQTI